MVGCLHRASQSNKEKRSKNHRVTNNAPMHQCTQCAKEMKRQGARSKDQEQGAEAEARGNIHILLRSIMHSSLDCMLCLFLSRFTHPRHKTLSPSFSPQGSLFVSFVKLSPQTVVRLSLLLLKQCSECVTELTKEKRARGSSQVENR